MITIRRNLFETNSSSTHALCISMEHYWNNLNDLNRWRKEAAPIIVEANNYGRIPQKPLVFLKEKVDYLWTAVINYYFIYWDEKQDKLYFDDESINWWKEQILKVLPIGSSFRDINDYGHLPWIDHAQQLGKFIKLCEEQPRYIYCLLDDSSFIEISGDEYPSMINAFLPYNYNELINMPGKYSVYIKGN